MNYLLFNFMLILIMSFVVMKLTIIISNKYKYNNEKMSPFECGFMNISNTRMPFSIHFFLITVIFLIFDVEIAIILPAIKSLFFLNKSTWLFISSMILIILIIGLIHEWNQGSLNWF